MKLNYIPIFHDLKKLLNYRNISNSISCKRFFLPLDDRKDWQEISKVFKIHSISMDLGHKKIHEFSCEDIGLTCERFQVAPKDRIRAWCCAQAAIRAIAVMDQASEKIGFHYELDAGTLLGNT